MTFSRKKKKAGFSQLVADHLQSPKRVGSLVVETGFPTSLINLYVRNRGRFRRFSDKKRRGDVNCVVETVSEIDEGRSEEEEERGVEIGKPGEIEKERSVEIATSNEIDEERSRTEEAGGGEIGKLNRVLVAVLKVLFVVVLALGTKRFRAGITVSAFLLFFLEWVGKPMICRLSLISPCYDLKSCFNGTSNPESCKGKLSLVVCNQVSEVIAVNFTSSRRAKMKKLVPNKPLKGEISSGFKGQVLEMERASLSSDKELGGCLVLCLVVLVGLVVGRILALILALSWCLILKRTSLMVLVY